MICTASECSTNALICCPESIGAKRLLQSLLILHSEWVSSYDENKMLDCRTRFSILCSLSTVFLASTIFDVNFRILRNYPTEFRLPSFDLPSTVRNPWPRFQTPMYIHAHRQWIIVKRRPPATIGFRMADDGNSRGISGVTHHINVHLLDAIVLSSFSVWSPGRLLDNGHYSVRA